MTRRAARRPRLLSLSVSVALGLSALVALASAACGPKDRSGLPDAVPGSNPVSPVVASRDGGASDATPDGIAPQPDAGDAAPDAGDAAPDADAGACLAGATLSMDGAFAGALAVRGTLTLPAPLPAGRTLVLSVGQASGDTHTATFVTATTTDRFTFRIGGLAAGSYVVRAQADAGGNGVVNDAGDYDGYYDGSAAGPILVRADAKVVVLSAACVDNLSFGAGVKP